jgi:rhodanese-related sulfurtransferase
MLYGTISAEDFREVMDGKGSDNTNDKNTCGNFLILDVRTPMEFNMGHVDGAMNISHDEVPARISELLSYKNKRIYVICRSGNRSAFACDVMSRMGFSGCMNVMGGYMALDK